MQWIEGGFIVDTTVPEEDKQPKRKYAKRKDRKQAIIQILNNISNSLQEESAERSEIYFRNPFAVRMMGMINVQQCSPIENCASLQQTLGMPRFRLCLQLYSYFEDVFKIATGDFKYDLQHVVNTGSSLNDKRIIQLWVEIDEIKRRMKNVEKAITKQDITL